MNLKMEINSLKQRIAELEELAKEEQEFPKDGDEYWFMDINGDVASGKWENFDIEKDMLEIDNVFGAKEQAEFAAEKLKVEAELRKFSRPFKEDEYNYFIQIHPSRNNIVTESDDYYPTQGTIYFESTTIANEAIDTVGKERIKKYIFGVED